LRRAFTRTLLASAAIAAAVMLSGCSEDSIAPAGRAAAPLSDKTLALIAAKDMDKGSPILVRVFKEEAELEVWKQDRSGHYALLKTFPICKWSGDLGPKKKEGDRQAPEGFYTINPGQMNPNSNYYLAFNTGYPNSYDRSHGYTGSELMVHGDCSSRGCYAMTDEQIQEIYALARESFFGGQRAFQFQAFPFHMTALNMARHRNNPNFAFWKMLKEGYDHFEATKLEPKVAVCEQRYVFDADSGGKPFNPSGACPAYQLDKPIAQAVLDHRRDEQFKMAQYIAQGVATAPAHVGDGGMNPVFAQQLGISEGGSVQVANAPGALPHIPNPPGTTIPRSPALPQVASAVPTAVPLPHAPAAEPKRAPAEKPVLALRGASSEDREKPKTVTRTASAAATELPKPAKQAAAESSDDSNTLRTAFTAPPPQGTLLSGAQPTLPAGSFANRWSAWR
jgi:murein L,D-transpeptidase YafK